MSNSDVNSGSWASEPLVEVVRRWCAEQNRAHSAWMYFGLTVVFAGGAFGAALLALLRGSIIWAVFFGLLAFIAVHTVPTLFPRSGLRLLCAEREIVPDELLVVLAQAPEIDPAAKAEIAEQVRKGEVVSHFLYELCVRRARVRAEAERLQRPGVVAMIQLLGTSDCPGADQKLAAGPSQETPYESRC